MPEELTRIRHIHALSKINSYYNIVSPINRAIDPNLPENSSLSRNGIGISGWPLYANANNNQVYIPYYPKNKNQI